MSQSGYHSIIRNNKVVFIVIGIALVLIELQIFAVAAVKSGRRSMLQVIDDSGDVIYETNGTYLSNFNKYYFEKTFGPFENFRSRLITKEVAFPFRAWFTAAVCIPIGIFLLYGFLVKAYMALFYEEKTNLKKQDNSKPEHNFANNTQVSKIIQSFSEFNIFTIGFLIFVAAFAYWIIPNFFTYIAKVGLETIGQFKWLFAIVITAVFVFICWVIYLKYLLAKRSIDSQMELEKVKLQIALKSDYHNSVLIEHNEKKNNELSPHLLLKSHKNNQNNEK